MGTNYNSDLGEIGEEYFKKTIRHWSSSTVFSRNNKVAPDSIGIDLLSTISEFKGYYLRIEWQIKIRTSINIGTSKLFGNLEPTYNVKLEESELNSLKILCCSENDSFLVLGIPTQTMTPKEISSINTHNKIDLDFFKWYAIDLGQIRSYIQKSTSKSLSIPIPARNLLNLASFSLLLSSLKVNYYTKKKSLGIPSQFKNGRLNDLWISSLLASSDFDKTINLFKNMEGENFSNNYNISKFIFENVYSVLGIFKTLGKSTVIEDYSVYTLETLGEEIYFWLFFTPFFSFIRHYNLHNNSRRAFPIDEKEIKSKSLSYRTILYLILRFQKHCGIFSMYAKLDEDLPQNVTSNLNGNVFKFDYRKISIKKQLLNSKKVNLFKKDPVNRDMVEHILSKPYIHNGMHDIEILDKLELTEFKNEIFLLERPPRLLFPSEASNIFIRYPIELFPLKVNGYE